MDTELNTLYISCPELDRHLMYSITLDYGDITHVTTGVTPQKALQKAYEIAGALIGVDRCKLNDTQLLEDIYANGQYFFHTWVPDRPSTLKDIGIDSETKVRATLTMKHGFTVTLAMFHRNSCGDKWERNLTLNIKEFHGTKSAARDGICILTQFLEEMLPNTLRKMPKKMLIAAVHIWINRGDSLWPKFSRIRQTGLHYSVAISCELAHISSHTITADTPKAAMTQAYQFASRLLDSPVTSIHRRSASINITAAIASESDGPISIDLCDTADDQLIHHNID